MAPRMLKYDIPKHLKVPLLESRGRLLDVPIKHLKIFPNKGAKGSQKELQRAPQNTKNHITNCKKRTPRATPGKVDPLKGSRDGQNMKNKVWTESECHPAKPHKPLKSDEKSPKRLPNGAQIHEKVLQVTSWKNLPKRSIKKGRKN